MNVHKCPSTPEAGGRAKRKSRQQLTENYIKCCSFGFSAGALDTLNSQNEPRNQNPTWKRNNGSTEMVILWHLI